MLRSLHRRTFPGLPSLPRLLSHETSADRRKIAREERPFGLQDRVVLGVKAATVVDDPDYNLFNILGAQKKTRRRRSTIRRRGGEGDGSTGIIVGSRKARTSLRETVASRSRF